MSRLTDGQTPELRQVLSAIEECRRRVAGSPDWIFCYSWIVDEYERQYGVRFHQSRLQQLAKSGLLRPDASVHGGNRRYYRLVAA